MVTLTSEVLGVRGLWEIQARRHSRQAHHRLGGQGGVKAGAELESTSSDPASWGGGECYRVMLSEVTISRQAKLY